MKHGAKLPIILIGLGLSWGCAADLTGPEVGESFTLKLGQRITLELIETEVQFLLVAADSRCPRGAQCFWEGYAAAVFKITARDGDAVEHTLYPGVGSRGIVLDGSELVFLELKPYPELSRRIAPGDYQAVLVLRRLE